MTAVSGARGAGSWRALLEGAIDYAGLYPPASLGMQDAALNYLEYALGGDAWALGRFVVPISRLQELREVAVELTGSDRAAWRLSVVAGPSVEIGARQLEAFRREAEPTWMVDAIEVKATSAQAVGDVGPFAPFARQLYVELPLAGDFVSAARQVAALGACVKIRTGGVTAESFPSVRRVAEAIVTCARIPVAFKATAGLHHPLRGEYPLTYALDSEVGIMFGYVNLLLAAVLARAGRDVEVVTRALDEVDGAALSFGDSDVRWRDERFPLDDLRVARREFVHGFGSCSFREPLDEFGLQRTR